MARRLGGRPDRAAEFPAPLPAALLDASVYVLYPPVAWLARARSGPVPVTALFPPAGRRERLSVLDLGVEAPTPNRDPAALRHITATGGENRLVQAGGAAAGRVAKVEIPSAQPEAGCPP